jgi:hypothetical protein
MVKYAISTSEDDLKYQLSCGNIQLYEYKSHAERDKRPWDKVFKITMEEI